MKTIRISNYEWDGGSSSKEQFIGYFTAKNRILEEAVAEFTAQNWNKVLFHRVLGVYSPIGLGFPDNVAGLEISIEDFKREGTNYFTVSTEFDITDKRVREELIKIHPYTEAKRIDFSFIEKDIFENTGTHIGRLEHWILTEPNINWNFLFNRLWEANTLLCAFIQETGVFPEWYDTYVRFMMRVNFACDLKDFRQNKIAAQKE